MIPRRRLLMTGLFASVLAIIGSASYLGVLQRREAQRYKRRDPTAVSRVIYYRVEREAGPRFRLSGGEGSVRLISHLALDRSSAWPPESYRPHTRYPYALLLIYRDPLGQEIWRKKVYISSSISKGQLENGRWQAEASFSEERSFVPSDSRITQVDFPNEVAVNASLEVRLLDGPGEFSMVRAYGLHESAPLDRWLRGFAMSEESKRDLVDGVSYLEWDEFDQKQREARLSTESRRLTASSNVQDKSKIVALYLSSYRVERALREERNDDWLLAPWNKNYILGGPAEYELKLRANTPEAQKVMSTGQHALRTTLINTYGESRSELHPVKLDADAPQEEFLLPISIPPGVHNLRIAWNTDRALAQHQLDLRQRGPGVYVQKARSQEAALDLRLEALDFGSRLQSGDIHPPTAPPNADLSKVYRDTMYYLDAGTGALRFSIPTQDLRSRLFRIESRAWDLDAHLEGTLDLHYRFLDADGREISSFERSFHHPFDPQSWVERRSQLSEHDKHRPFVVGVGESIRLTGLAPPGSKWIELRSDQPALLKVSGRIRITPRATHLPSPFSEIPLQGVRWRMVPTQPRNWIPVLADEHPTWTRQGWIVRVSTPIHLDPWGEENNEEHGPKKRWKAILALGRPLRHRVLERLELRRGPRGPSTEFRDYSSYAALWEDCPNCWIELLASQDYRSLDELSRPNDPQLLWFNESPAQQSRASDEVDWGARCTLWLDERSHEDDCPLGKRKDPRSELSQGSHQLSWRSTSPNTRLWIDRWALAQGGRASKAPPRIFIERRLENLGSRGLRYSVHKGKANARYLNFRIYRRLSARSQAGKARRFELILDQGKAKRRVGELFETFTSAQRVHEIEPTRSQELVFLDRDTNALFERYDIGFFIGEDIAPGLHQVQLRALDGGDYWVRAFEQDRLGRERSDRFFQSKI